MPLEPPVTTATLPSSFPMTYPSRFNLWSVGEGPEALNMGPPDSGIECESAHIGGAKSIRLDDWRRSRRSVFAARNWGARVDIGYEGLPLLPSDMLDTGLAGAPRRCRIAP